MIVLVIGGFVWYAAWAFDRSTHPKPLFSGSAVPTVIINEGYNPFPLGTPVR
jgi:hypothetical protein